MKINNISGNQNFEGNLVVKNNISAQQRHFFEQHKPELEKMIKDMPFDLFVEQSKSKKTINLSTNVKDAAVFTVRKNDKNFPEAAAYAISDGMKKSEAYKKLQKANEILEYVKYRMSCVIFGKFKEAREASKIIAKLGVEDFEIYKSMTNFKITNLPSEANYALLKNSIIYKIYGAFTRKTSEEKQLIKMNKQYMKEMKAQGKKLEPTVMDFRQLY